MTKHIALSLLLSLAVIACNSGAPAPIGSGDLMTEAEEVAGPPDGDIAQDSAQPGVPEADTVPGLDTAWDSAAQTTPPTPAITSQEWTEVIPQTVLHLSGGDSHAAHGLITAWRWSVDQPMGSRSVFVPSEEVADPTFELNVAGHYTFYLDVWDEYDQQSAQPAIMQVDVIPDEAIHVELLWLTPEDPDETDEGPEAGSDMDLHFTHPWAEGPDLDEDGAPDGWFDQPFDCFWFNAHPEWASFNPDVDDDPGLDRDDTDGAGPENINLNLPEDVTYKVGVHYWNDHGYGPSYATVRVYIDSVLVFEATDAQMFDSDLWEVCEIHWPSAEVELVLDPDGTSYKITPDYQNPFFFQ